MNVSLCPTFSKGEALLVLEKEWGITKVIKALDSYLDQNFLVQNNKGEKFVLKIANGRGLITVAETVSVLVRRQPATLFKILK